MSELLIRPGPNDHKVIQDLLAPGGASVFLPRARPLIDRLVLDAQVARARPEFADVAGSIGLPILIDPLTPFWQGELREKDRWAQLPFGRAEKLDATDLASPFVREGLVSQVVDFQVEHGATAIIPPYLYVVSPADPYFEVTLDFVRATGRYMAREGLALPLMPVLCAQLKGFGSERGWRDGIDRFVSVALDLGPEAIGICLSPAGTGNDSYSKILRLFASSRRIKLSGTRVIAWRQGIYGPGLVAAGLDGYETGVGTRELCNVSSSIASRRPPKPGKKAGGGGLPGIYLEPLHRSVSSRVGETLLGHRSLRPKVMCDDERCCPDGAASTLDQRRQHAIRTRAREIAAIENQPHTSWRLHQIAKDARAAADLALQVNKVLQEAGVPERIGTTSYDSLARVAEFLREGESTSAAA